MKSIAIIGGGISGLSLAFYLKRKGHTVTVFESERQGGGVITTEQFGEYKVEWGAHTALANRELVELINLLSLQSELILPAKKVKKRFIGTLNASGNLVPTAAPSGIFQAIRSPLLSTRAKLRLLNEPFIRKEQLTEESVASFVTRRFGKEVLDNLIAPALSGIWAGDVEQLSARSMLKKLWGFEQQGRSVILGAIGSLFNKKQSVTIRGPIAFRSGMSTLIESLSKNLQSELVLEAAVESLKEEGTQISLSISSAEGKMVRSFDLVYCTASAVSTARLLSTLGFRGEVESVIKALQKIPYAPVGLLHLALPKSGVSNPLDGFGVLIPPRFDTAILGAIFTSSILPERAPTDHHLISCFVGGTRNKEMADLTQATNRERVITEVKELLGISLRPEIIAYRHLVSAVPNYNLGHHELVEKMEQFEALHQKIKIIGNFREGVSVSDRIRISSEIAAAS